MSMSNPRSASLAGKGEGGQKEALNRGPMSMLNRRSASLGRGEGGRQQA